MIKHGADWPSFKDALVLYGSAKASVSFRGKFMADIAHSAEIDTVPW